MRSFAVCDDPTPGQRAACRLSHPRPATRQQSNYNHCHHVMHKIFPVSQFFASPLFEKVMLVYCQKKSDYGDIHIHHAGLCLWPVHYSFTAVVVGFFNRWWFSRAEEILQAREFPGPTKHACTRSFGRKVWKLEIIFWAPAVLR